jgi:hypothetical protein
MAHFWPGQNTAITAACICAVLAPALPCHSRAPMLQRPLCSAAHALLYPCARITSLHSCRSFGPPPAVPASPRAAAGCLHSTLVLARLRCTCARICCTLAGSLCPRSNRATLHRRFPPPGSLPRGSTLARATWACSCPGRATRARAANRASSALRARSAHLRAEPPVLPVARARAAHLRLHRSRSRPRQLASAQRLRHPAVALPARLRSPALAYAPLPCAARRSG